MALGRPAVLTPKALDIRAVQGSVNAIRERLQFIEQAITLATAQTNSSSAKGDITALQAQLIQLTTRVTNLEAAVGGDTEVDLVAEATIVAGDPVVMVGLNSCAPADASDPAAIYAVVGLAKTGATTGQFVTVTRWGNFDVIDGALDTGRAVYVNEGGGLTQYPSYAEVAIPVGVATGAATVWVAPAWPSLRALGFESGYEDFLPPTVGLVRDAVLLADDFNAAASGITVKTGENDVTTRTLTGTTARVSVANGTGVAGNPTVDIDAAYVGQTSITTLGTIGTGTWAGTTITPDHGGTGVANAAGSTFTLGAAHTLAGAFTSTFTLTGVTSVTFPTSGTLATTASLPVGANPTASVGLTAVNGVATTFMRSDGAPALSVAISPTWVGTHTFSNTIVGSVNGNAATATALQTARNINGVSFNGTADITVTAAAGTLTGATLAAGVTASSLTSVGTIASGTWAGTAVAADHGGTGLTSYAIGDLVYANTTTTLAKLADVATGNVVLSGGVGVAPAYGKVGLTTHVSGTLGAANGGTGVANAAGSTITLGGALTLSGAFASTFTMTGTTTVTFPTSGTLATTAQLPAGANPTASVGLAAVNGVATSFMRSDGAPALSVAILPTWTGVHKWNLNATALTSFTPAPTLQIAQADTTACSVLLDSYGAGNSFIGRRAQGTAAAKSAVQSGQGLGGFQALGYGTTAYATQVTGVILMAATENWTDTAWGTELQIFTTKTGTTTRSTTFKVNDAAVVLTTDNQELQLGAGTDLRLYHDGTNSVIRNDTGDLLFKAGATTYYTLASTGASTFAGVVTGNSFVPSSSTVPTDGMYLPAANNLGWAVSSAVAMRLNATGLGVGKTPAQKLDVEGTAAAGQVVGRIGNTSNSNGSAAVLCLDASNNGFGVRDGQIRATNNGSNAITISVWTANGAAPTEKLQVTPAGQLALQVAGQGISIKEGSNAKMGTATLVAGTVVVNTTAFTANSRIFLMYQSFGTITLPSSLGVSARTAGTSFTITSAAVTDTSVVGWVILEPS